MQLRRGLERLKRHVCAFNFMGSSRRAYRLAPGPASSNAELLREMFQSAQWALSSEGRRFARADGCTRSQSHRWAMLVRERQDLIAARLHPRCLRASRAASSPMASRSRGRDWRPVDHTAPREDGWYICTNRTTYRFGIGFDLIGAAGGN